MNSSEGEGGKHTGEADNGDGGADVADQGRGRCQLGWKGQMMVQRMGGGKQTYDGKAQHQMKERKKQRQREEEGQGKEKKKQERKR